MHDGIFLSWLDCFILRNDGETGFLPSPRGHSLGLSSNSPSPQEWEREQELQKPIFIFGCIPASIRYHTCRETSRSMSQKRSHLEESRPTHQQRVHEIFWLLLHDSLCWRRFSIGFHSHWLFPWSREHHSPCGEYSRLARKWTWFYSSSQFFQLIFLSGLSLRSSACIAWEDTFSHVPLSPHHIALPTR